MEFTLLGLSLTLGYVGEMKVWRQLNYVDIILPTELIRAIWELKGDFQMVSLSSPLSVRKLGVERWSLVKCACCSSRGPQFSS